MDTNENKAKSFAEEGLEETQKEAAEVEATMQNLTDTAADVDSDDDGEMVQLGGLEPIVLFFHTKAPKNTPKVPFKILEKGSTITGTYERSFIAGKYKNPTYVIRMSKDAAPVAGVEVAGKLVGIGGTGNHDPRKGRLTGLNGQIAKLQEGSKIKITYEGMSTMKGGEWAGNDAHNFTAFGNKLKPT